MRKIIVLLLTVGLIGSLSFGFKSSSKSEDQKTIKVESTVEASKTQQNTPETDVKSKAQYQKYCPKAGSPSCPKNVKSKMGDKKSKHSSKPI